MIRVDSMWKNKLKMLSKIYSRLYFRVNSDYIRINYWINDDYFNKKYRIKFYLKSISLKKSRLNNQEIEFVKMQKYSLYHVLNFPFLQRIFEPLSSEWKERRIL